MAKKKLKRVRSALPKKLSKTTMEDIGFSVDERVSRVLNNILIEAGQLEDADTRELWLDSLQTFARTGSLVGLLRACEWRRRVVPIDEFLFSKIYLGIDENAIYPGVLTAAHDLDTDNYVEAVLTGAIGTGKSFLSNAMLARNIYKLSCMRYPQSSLGIQSKSSIVFTIQSVRFNTAKKAIFEELGQYINPSTYFKQVFPYDHKVVSQMIFREFNISILPVASGTTGAISMNVLGGILDEVNFMQKVTKSQSTYAEVDGTFDQARSLYTTLSRRRRSRFTKKGNLPGCLYLVSSSLFPTDFTEVKAKESTMEGGNDPKVYVFRHSQWSSKSRDQFLPENFRVQVGNDMIRSKILKEEERHMPGCDVIEVPMDFFTDFQKDIDGSLRDFAGRTSLALSPFFGRRDSIHECMNLGATNGYVNPFNVEVMDLSIGIPKPDVSRLRIDVPSFRACHIDLGLNKDACGFAVGHIAGVKVIEKKNPENNKMYLEILPIIGIDLAIRIVPPPNGEIEFAKVRELLYLLRNVYKLDIKYVSLDGFQSVDSRQILRRHDFQTDYLSVEKIEPYRALRDTMYDGRVLLPRSNILASELAELEVVIKGTKEKIDHRPAGSKDVADAVCGVVSFLLKRRAAWAGLSLDSRVGMHLLGERQGISSDSIDKEVMGISTSGRKLSNRKKSIRRKDSLRKDIKRLTKSAK